MRLSYAVIPVFIVFILLTISCGSEDPIAPPVNEAPDQPTINVNGGAPPDGSASQPLNPMLCWNCTDPEGDSIFYDVYFDDDDASTLVSDGQTKNSFSPGTLEYNTTYAWKVEAEDKGGHSSISEVWTFTTLSAPGLAVSDSLLDFEDALTDLTFAITNTGEDTLSWTITVDSAWITVDIDSGATVGETDTVTVTVDRSTMGCDDYAGEVIIVSDTLADTIAVMMQVTGPPTLAIAPVSLDYPGDVGVDTIIISNTTPECAMLNWSITTSKGWLGALPNSGVTGDQPQIVEIYVDRTGLCEGNYNGAVEIVSDGGDTTVPVAAEVVVANLTGSFTASTQCGNAPLSVTFQASLSGGIPPYTVNWDFGDGSNGSGTTVNHQYSTVGQYLVSATASDSCGDSYPLGSKSITVIAAEYVILGHNTGFTDYNYADSGVNGAGHKSVASETSVNGAHASAWCDDDWGEAWANGWAVIGRQFTTDDCGGISYMMADIIFEIHYLGKLNVSSGVGRADLDIDVRLYDLTADSMVVNDSVFAVRRTGGWGLYPGNPTATMADVKIESGHTYRAFIFLSAGVSIDNSFNVYDVAHADCRSQEPGLDRFGAYLDELRIEFK